MGPLTPIIGLRLLALAAGLRHNAEIGQPGLCFSAYGHKFGINHLARFSPPTAKAAETSSTRLRVRGGSKERLRLDSKSRSTDPLPLCSAGPYEPGPAVASVAQLAPASRTPGLVSVVV